MSKADPENEAGWTPAAIVLSIAACVAILLAIVSGGAWIYQATQRKFWEFSYDEILVTGYEDRVREIHSAFVDKEAPRIWFQFAGSTPMSASQLSPDELSKLDEMHSEFDRDSKGCLVLSGPPGKFKYRDGKMVEFVFDGGPNWRIGPAKVGPFVQIECKVDVFIEAFGEPNSRVYFPVVAP